MTDDDLPDYWIYESDFHLFPFLSWTYTEVECTIEVCIEMRSCLLLKTHLDSFRHHHLLPVLILMISFPRPHIKT